MDDKGAKRKSKRRNKKALSNSSLSQISYENTDSLKTKKNPDMKVFSDRLLLLVHSLLSLADCSPSQVLRAKCKEHLEDNWLQQPLVLQSCMATVNVIDNKKVQSLSLSDSGSTLSFVSVRFAKKHNLSVMGQWSGSVQTLHNTKKVFTNFYKLDFSTTNGHHAVLCLETSG